MSQSYRIYQQGNIELAKSFVIKHESDALQQNSRLSMLGYSVDETDPTTWKYYLNLSGEYHESDEVLTIISSDTLEEIEFRKEVLANHPLTRNEYGEKQELYNQLIESYPLYRDLIDRILEPLDINEAIEADDFKILFWDQDLIASNETNLIPGVQKWIDGYVSRWNVSAMALSDPYYHTAFSGIMSLNIPNVINNIRLANVGTSYVGQWHLWTYLASHYNISQFQGSLTLAQSIYLYRNIRYIRKHMGEEGQFLELQEVLFRTVGLEAYRYDMVKLDSNYVNTGTLNVRFNRAKYNSENIDLDIIGLLDSDDMIEYTRELTYFNDIEAEDDAEYLDRKLRSTDVNTQSTEIVEVSQVPEALGRFFSISILKMQYWIYLSTMGYYNEPITISVPGKRSLTMTPRDAFILFIYSTQEAYGTEEERSREVIPQIRVDRVLPETPIDRSALEGTLDEKHIDVKGYLDEILTDRVSLRQVNSLDEFGDFVTEVRDRQIYESLIARYAYTPEGRAMLKGTMINIYIDQECDLTDITDYTFAQWASDNVFDFSEYTTEDFINTANECLAKAADINDTGSTLPKYQLDLIEVMRKLTSYSLSLIDGVAYRNSRGINWYESDFWISGNVLKYGTFTLSPYIEILEGEGSGTYYNLGGDIETESVDFFTLTTKSVAATVPHGQVVSGDVAKETNGYLDLGSMSIQGSATILSEEG